MANVVLLEEDETVSGFVVDILKTAGHTVHTSTDLASLPDATSGDADLVIADAGLMSAPQQVLTAARAACPTLPVLLTTTFLDPLEERLLLRLGANAVLRKPFDLPTFLDLVTVLTASRTCPRIVS